MSQFMGFVLIVGHPLKVLWVYAKAISAQVGAFCILWLCSVRLEASHAVSKVVFVSPYPDPPVTVATLRERPKDTVVGVTCYGFFQKALRSTPVLGGGGVAIVNAGAGPVFFTPTVAIIGMRAVLAFAGFHWLSDK